MNIDQLWRESIIDAEVEQAAAIAEELARNLRARKDPRFGNFVVWEALTISLPVLERHLRAAQQRLDAEDKQ